VINLAKADIITLWPMGSYGVYFPFPGIMEYYKGCLEKNVKAGANKISIK